MVLTIAQLAHFAAQLVMALIVLAVIAVIAYLATRVMLVHVQTCRDSNNFDHARTWWVRIVLSWVAAAMLAVVFVWWIM